MLQFLFFFFCPKFLANHMEFNQWPNQKLGSSAENGRDKGIKLP